MRCKFALSLDLEHDPNESFLRFSINTDKCVIQEIKLTHEGEQLNNTICIDQEEIEVLKKFLNFWFS